MKQKILCISLLGLLLFGCFMTACDTTSEESDALTISFDMPETPETVPSYYLAERMFVDEEEALSYFFEGEDPIKDDFQSIVGERYYIEDEKAQNVTYKSLQIQNGAITSDLPDSYPFYGGMSYYQYSRKADLDTYQKYKVYSSISSQKYINEAYSKEADLEFRSREDVQAELRSFLDRVGLEQAELDQCYSMDAETMQYLADKYIREEEITRQNAAVQNPDWEDLEPHTFTKEEEAYFLTYAQEVDGHRFCNLDLGLGMSTPGGSILYTQNGITCLDFSHFVHVLEAGEPTEVVAPQECLDEYIREFNLNLEPDPTELTLMGLYYVPTKLEETEEKEYIPVWILEIRTEKMSPQGQEEVDYRYRVWNAITGEGMTSTR